MPLALPRVGRECGPVRTGDACSPLAELTDDEVAATFGVHYVAVESFRAQWVGFRNDDVVGHWARPAVLLHHFCELARAVARPVERAVPAALHGDERAVGARHEARAVVGVGVVARLQHAPRVVMDGLLWTAVTVITVGIPLPHAGGRQHGPHL